MTELECLALRFGTDKSGHRYCAHYERLIGEFQFLPCTLIEIGASEGCSLRMWREWMPEARIYGLDNNDYKYRENGITVFKGDQSNTDDLDKMVKETGRFHLLIDDAGHDRGHQAICFNHLWPKLLEGGWYIIEDLDSNKDFGHIGIDDNVQELHFFMGGSGSGILFLKKR